MNATLVQNKIVNNQINTIKGLACIFVVLMHCEFPGIFGIFVQSISRFCVPFFFAVSGYYCYYSELGQLRTRIPLKIKHILKITLIASLFYLICAVVSSLFNHSNILTAFNWTALVKFFVFNQPFIRSHLWFLFALLYGLFVFAIFEKYGLLKKSFFLIPFLLFFYFVLAYGLHILGIKIPNCVYRNWIFEGLPLMLAGYYIHANEDKLPQSGRTILFIVLGGVLSCLVERLFLGRDFGMHIGALFVVLGLFCYAIKYSQSNRFVMLQKIGDKLSLWVYVMHIFVWKVIFFFATICAIQDSLFFLWIQPVLVVAFTLLSGKAFYWFKERIVVNLNISK